MLFHKLHIYCKLKFSPSKQDSVVAWVFQKLFQCKTKFRLWSIQVMESRAFITGYMHVNISQCIFNFIDSANTLRYVIKPVQCWAVLFSMPKTKPTKHRKKTKFNKTDCHWTKILHFGIWKTNQALWQLNISYFNNVNCANVTTKTLTKEVSIVCTAFFCFFCFQFLLISDACQ